MAALIGSLQSGQSRLAREASQAAQMQRCAHGSSRTRTCADQQTAQSVAGASPSSGDQAAEPAAAAATAAAGLIGECGGASALGESDGCSPPGPKSTKRKP